MFGHRSRSSSGEIAHRLEALRTDISLLGEALAGAAEESTRGPRARAGHYAQDAVAQLAHRAEDVGHHVGHHAGTLAASGLEAARKGRDVAWRELDAASQRTQEVVARHPGTVVLAAIGVGLLVGCVLSLAAQEPRRSGGASLGGALRRPLAKVFR
ncbi:hypothetical protein EDC64_10881 [Aquabacter spiritensis]|uniref:ElaB/YqjD/DUF883 family membrane-anchored ribosome-binding protein n=1 Tax=Aquabacter spiritensis TaxID=933073 RepID=A0A4R3LYS0_9HYPH|nr:hypothetical protein EDC64_10881 [Aquabacter spiritensis]